MLQDPITISPKLIQEIIQREDAEFRKRTPKSHEMHERAKSSLPAGVASSFQAVPPYPLFLNQGEKGHVWDIDGNEYVDFHLGFGSLLVGHAHPVLVEALRDQVGRGLLYSLPSPEVVLLAEEMVRRFTPIEQVRFTNSGTEATMEAVRMARAFKKRDKIVKIEGSYHGHHDVVMMSTKPSRELAGPPDRPNTVPASKGIPAEVKSNVVIAPYNDAEGLDRILTEHEGEVAAVITEAVLMNVGIMLPEPGYLQQVRDVTRKHDVLLIFDEVKTGVTVAPGGISELYPVGPDLICLAKSIGGGMPIGAFGGRRDIMNLITTGDVLHLGTFNGNPMSMRAGLVTLTQIFTAEAHTYANDLSSQLARGYSAVIEEYGMPMHVSQIGAKGCAMFRYQRARNYRAWWEIDMDLSYAYWLFLVNRGILFPPGLDDQWTVSVQHTQSDIDHHLHVFQQFVKELSK